MEYIAAFIFIGLSIAYITFRVNKQIRLVNELKKSQLIVDLLENDYKLVDKSKYTGNHKGYQTGFYYHKDPKADLIGFATIDCDIPFTKKTKGSVEKMMNFSKKHKSLGLAIDSRAGFSKELDKVFLLKSNKGEIFKIFDNMVSVALKEGFKTMSNKT